MTSRFGTWEARSRSRGVGGEVGRIGSSPQREELIMSNTMLSGRTRVLAPALAALGAALVAAPAQPASTVLCAARQAATGT